MFAVSCKLAKNAGLAKKADLSRYQDLHPHGRRLISSWFERAWSKIDCQPQDSFEPFIYAWIAVNGWAACISGLDKDRDWLDALMLNHNICKEFTRTIEDNKSKLSIQARKFSGLWPIFKVQSLRKAKLQYRGLGTDRRKIVKGYLNAGINDFEPKCWKRHTEAGEDVPIDWPHTLAALYRVRCNLFHGEKAVHSEMDGNIVFAAFQVLVHFLRNRI